MQTAFIGDWRGVHVPDDPFGNWVTRELKAFSGNHLIVTADAFRRGHDNAAAAQILQTGPDATHAPSRAYSMLFRLAANPLLVRDAPAIDRAVANVLAEGEQRVVSRVAYRQAQSEIRSLLKNLGRLAEFSFAPDRIPTPKAQANAIRHLIAQVSQNPELLERGQYRLSAAALQPLTRANLVRLRT